MFTTVRQVPKLQLASLFRHAPNLSKLSSQKVSDEWNEASGRSAEEGERRDGKGVLHKVRAEEEQEVRYRIADNQRGADNSDNSQDSEDRGGRGGGSCRGRARGVLGSPEDISSCQLLLSLHCHHSGTFAHGTDVFGFSGEHESGFQSAGCVISADKGGDEVGREEEIVVQRQGGWRTVGTEQTVCELGKGFRIQVLTSSGF